jgi:hypothetical protein
MGVNGSQLKFLTEFGLYPKINPNPQHAKSSGAGRRHRKLTVKSAGTNCCCTLAHEESEKNNPAMDVVLKNHPSEEAKILADQRIWALHCDERRKQARLDRKLSADERRSRMSG